MKIWIDFINTPQVSFWVPFIKEFKENNNEIVLTCRDSGNTIELLRQQGLDFHVIGKKVGKSTLQKLLYFPKRLTKLYFFIRKNKPDIAASQSSFYQPVVARLLGIRCLYTNDNEHAKGNFLGFVFANTVLLPVALKNEKFVKKWPLKSKIAFYPSVKEAIYLCRQPDLIQLIPGKKNIIYFRPEPWSAQYYNGPLNFFDETLLLLSSGYKVIILPRDKNQIVHYKQEKFNNISVAERPLNLKDIISDCMLFIGAGGSMTREIAVLGIPVISIYQSEMLCVDKYLIDKGRMMIIPKISYDEIRNILNNENNSLKDLSVLDEGKSSFDLFKNQLLIQKNEQN